MIARPLVAFVSGSIFGAGLAISGMMNPARVRGFLDLFGRWDPTLLFVMGGATAVMAIAWFIQRRLERPALDNRFFVPDRRDIDTKLIGGAILFGVGWGLAGLCPGPAVASLAVNFTHVIAFVVAMFVGMVLFRLVEERI